MFITVRSLRLFLILHVISFHRFYVSLRSGTHHAPCGNVAKAVICERKSRQPSWRTSTPTAREGKEYPNRNDERNIGGKAASGLRQIALKRQGINDHTLFARLAPNGRRHIFNKTVFSMFPRYRTERSGGVVHALRGQGAEASASCWSLL